MVFRGALRRDPGDLNELTEDVGNVLNGVTFVLFGAILLGPALGDLTWELALYAVLSLTLVRMVPVAIAMLGSRARAPTVGFLGWFGPRGLASIVFAVIVIEESKLPHENLIVNAIYVTWDFRSSPTASRRPARRPLRPLVRQHPRERAPPMESVPAEVTRPRGHQDLPTGRSRPDRAVRAALDLAGHRLIPCLGGWTTGIAEGGGQKRPREADWVRCLRLTTGARTGRAATPRLAAEAGRSCATDPSPGL